MTRNSLFGRHHLTSRLIPAFTAGALLAAAATGRADTVVGLFSDVQTSGPFTLEGGIPAYLNNSGTAFYSIENSTSLASFNPVIGVVEQTIPSYLHYGENLVLGHPNSGGEVLFVGKTVPAIPTQPFDLGSVIFVNGLGDASTDIFGAKLTLYATPDGTVGSALPHGSTELGIQTTQDFSVITHGDLLVPDSITLSGTMNKFLSVPEGRLAVAELFGRFVNGQIQVTDLVYNYGDPGSFVATGATPVPETSGLLAPLAIAGVIGFECWQRRRRAAAVVA